MNQLGFPRNFRKKWIGLISAEYGILSTIIPLNTEFHGIIPPEKKEPDRIKNFINGNLAELMNNLA